MQSSERFPRLHKAWHDEQLYLLKKRDAQRGGYINMDVAMEEMLRSFRALSQLRPITIKSVRRDTRICNACGYNKDHPMHFITHYGRSVGPKTS